MSSPPGGAVIALKDAVDLLHKFITESTKVQAVTFMPLSGTRSFILGIVKSGPEGLVTVIDGNAPSSPRISFDPRLAAVIRYGDQRVLPKDALPGMFERTFVSGLTFLFPDNSMVALFECAPE